MPELRFGAGLNQLDDELLSPDECIDGENFLLAPDSRSFRPRPSQDLKDTATNGLETRGIMQLIKRDDVDTTLIQNNETVYEWDGSTFTSKATVSTDSLLRGTYWSLDELLIITDLAKTTTVRTWDGSTMAVMTHAIAGVTNLYAKYAIVWNHRLWLFNVTTDSNANPHVILASEYENFDNMDNAQTPAATSLTYSAPFFLTTPDLKPINGVEVFYDTVIFSTIDGRLFKITGNDATNYAVSEYYSGSSAAGQELMVNSGNDVIFARRGGKIESLRSTEQYGDTHADDVSRWIPDEVKGMSSGIAVYDQTNQRVAIFTGNKVLVLSKYLLETSQTSPWMKWTTQLSTNFDVKAAAYIRIPGSTDYSIYYGGPNGEVYDLNGTGTGDAGMTLIKAYRKTGLINQLPTLDNNVFGRVHYRRKGSCDFSMTFEWTDEYAESYNTVPLKAGIVSAGTTFWGGASYWAGDMYWGDGGITQPLTSTAGFSAVGKSPSFFLTTEINSTVDFLVHKIETD